MYKEMKDSGVNLSAVVIWGITDSTSWIGGYPLLFDKDYQAKPSYYAVIDTDSEVEKLQTMTAYRYDGTDADLNGIGNRYGTVPAPKPAVPALISRQLGLTKTWSFVFTIRQFQQMAKTPMLKFSETNWILWEVSRLTTKLLLPLWNT